VHIVLTKPPPTPTPLHFSVEVFKLRIDVVVDEVVSVFAVLFCLFFVFVLVFRLLRSLDVIVFFLRL